MSSPRLNLQPCLTTFLFTLFPFSHEAEGEREREREIKEELNSILSSPTTILICDSVFLIALLYLQTQSSPFEL
ncbi:hypothetical protein M5K25_001019 [Dendrobium thyrsiflorum]|uniref:Uncharacterized protein n=1 Tax=Dendrobium thyrsiflorum TaxID=117978 RepID=A0ABD0VUZ2_DENTH